MTPWKKEKILSRDGHQCGVCGTDKQLRLFPLTPVPGSLKPGDMPSVLFATACKKHRRQIRGQNKGRKVMNPDAAFQAHCRIYHEGVYRAEQHLLNL